MQQARTEARKQARIRRLEKAAELQSALEDHAAARRFHQELAEMERDRIRYTARFRAVVRPDKPETRTSSVKKRITNGQLPSLSLQSSSIPQPSSWVVDDLGMRGVSWQQSYLGRRSANFYAGAARDHWGYLARDEAVLLGPDGEPVIVSNMGEDWVEIGIAWQAMQDASTRANAKIQIRAIVPFDADASPEEMRESLCHFGETILVPLGLPYSAVIHAPPEHGDQRNFHGHIAFSLRPMRRIAPYEWEIADEVRGELDGRDGVQMLRHLWAYSMSEAAERAQRNTRYTGLGYGARGLDLEAGEHLGEGRSAILARGGHVWAHERNRIKNARNAARRAIRDADRKIAALTAIRDAALARSASGKASIRPATVLHGPRVPTPALRIEAPVARPAPSAAPIVSPSELVKDRKPISAVSRPRMLRPSVTPEPPCPLRAPRGAPRAPRELTPLPDAVTVPRPAAMLAATRGLPVEARGLRGRVKPAPIASVLLRPAKPVEPVRTLVTSGRELTLPGSLAPSAEVRAPRLLASNRRDKPAQPRQLVASERPQPAIRLPRPRSVAPPKQLGPAERPQDGTLFTEWADLLRRLAAAVARARVARKREAARHRERPVALADLPYITDLPILEALPNLGELEHDSARVPSAPVLSREDRARVDYLIKIDAYVADYQGGTLDLHPNTLKAIHADDSWSHQPEVQAELAVLRADQQQVMARLAREAERRPLAFARTGTRLWPRDLDPASLARLDRWAADEGFQRDMFAIELAIGKAHGEHERARGQAAAEKAAATSRRIPDGFGGWRDTPAPAYHDPGPHARLPAFDRRNNRPTDQLLLLLKLAGEHPCSIVFASDDRLMVVPPAPGMLAPLLHGWRNDERVSGLVTETVRTSREAGWPTWPKEIAPVVRAYAGRGTGPGRASPPSDLGRGPSR